jgi:hypothetical protein
MRRGRSAIRRAGAAEPPPGSRRTDRTRWRRRIRRTRGRSCRRGTEVAPRRRARGGTAARTRPGASGPSRADRSSCRAPPVVRRAERATPTSTRCRIRARSRRVRPRRGAPAGRPRARSSSRDRRCPLFARAGQFRRRPSRRGSPARGPRSCREPYAGSALAGLPDLFARPAGARETDPRKRVVTPSGARADRSSTSKPLGATDSPPWDVELDRESSPVEPVHPEVVRASAPRGRLLSIGYRSSRYELPRNASRPPGRRMRAASGIHAYGSHQIAAPNSEIA